MTEEKHIRIVFRTAKKWFPDLDEATLKRFSEATVNRVQDAITDELEENEIGTVEDFDSLRKVKTEATGPIEPLPPPPQDGPAPSIIIDPDSPAAREILSDPNRFKAKTPLRLPNRGNVTPPLPGKKFWTQDQLRDYVEANTPDPMMVQIEGRPDPVPLKRNIEVQLGVDTVKLIYGIDYANAPNASQPNSPLLGEQLAPISVDTPVAVTIACDEQFPNIGGQLQRLADMAKAVYRPKPDHLASFTPRRVGPLTYRNDDPHEDVGPLTNRQTGKVW